MAKPLRALALILLWALFTPTPAHGGYDIAQAIDMTCEPGGPLIVLDRFKSPQDRDRVITEPGEVIGCPRPGYQIAAGPVQAGGEAGLCVYFTVAVGDGGDVCFVDTTQRVMPLMAIRAGHDGRLMLAGVANVDVPGAAMMSISDERGGRLGAPGAIRFFSLPTDERILCGARIGLLDASDGVPYAGPASRRCRTPTLPEAAVRLGSLASALQRWWRRLFIPSSP